ncbi:MAG: LytTR family DNA-binding domain-containing protein, partial [Cyclobacteriaceae bacterium]
MTKKLQVLIIDDEAPAREIIKLFLKDYDEIEVIGEAENGFEGLRAIREYNPDLIFLDIQMPKLTGFEMLELLDDYPKVIFSTAYDEYALKAFEHHAIDYLLKPFNRSRFGEAIKAVLSHAAPAKPEKAALLESYQDAPAHQIVVKDGTKIHIVPVDEIIRIAAQDDYAELITANNKYLKKQTMSHFEKMLDPKAFARVHRSSIVNISEIRNIEKYGKETHMATLKNGDEVIVSATGYSKLKEKLG